jgi:hypothetical protein
MYDDNGAGSAGGTDPLAMGFKFASIEPVRRRRRAGSVYESRALGRMEFSPMPSGRPSFWQSECAMPDSPFPFTLVCEVEGDALPGPDHVACVVALRRHMVGDAAAAFPLIEARLRALRLECKLGAEDLVLTAIRLQAHPLADAQQELTYRASTAPDLAFTVQFGRRGPHSVRVDSDA